MAITANDLIDIMNERFVVSEPIDWYGTEINVKKYLTLEEEELFVNKCSESAFDNSGNYCPNHCEFAMKVITIQLYTDIDLPDNIEDVNKVIRATQLYDIVTKTIDTEQYEEIIDSVWKKINYSIRLRENELSSKLDDVVTSMSSLANVLETSFNGVDANSLNNLIGMISSKNISEESIIRAISKLKSKNN